MLMVLQDVKAGDIINLEFRPGIRHYFLVGVAVVCGLSIFFYVFLGGKIFNPFASFYKNKIKPLAKRKIDKIIASDEEDY